MARSGVSGAETPWLLKLVAYALGFEGGWETTGSPSNGVGRIDPNGGIDGKAWSLPVSSGSTLAAQEGKSSRLVFRMHQNGASWAFCSQPYNSPSLTAMSMIVPMADCAGRALAGLLCPCVHGAKILRDHHGPW